LASAAGAAGTAAGFTSAFASTLGCSVGLAPQPDTTYIKPTAAITATNFFIQRSPLVLLTIIVNLLLNFQPLVSEKFRACLPKSRVKSSTDRNLLELAYKQALTLMNWMTYVRATR
jgi:hypothetical protein